MALNNIKYTTTGTVYDAWSTALDVTNAKTSIENKIDGITFPSDYAKEATLGTSSDSKSKSTIFGKIANLLYVFNNWVYEKWDSTASKVGTSTSGQTLFQAIESVTIPSGVAMEANATANKNEIIAAIPSVSNLATEANATANKNTILAAMPTIPTDYAKATNLSALDAKVGTATTSGATVMSYLEAIKAKTDDMATEATESEITNYFSTSVDTDGNLVLNSSVESDLLTLSGTIENNIITL